jgi:hypothetical protein
VHAPIASAKERTAAAVRFNYLPTISALLAMNHGENAKATDLLQTAVPNELGQPRSAVNGFFGALYPIYVRGQASLAARQGAEAAVEFQKILDHPGAVVSDPVRTLARLQLGRAYLRSGDKARARVAYQDFLNLWKDADTDIPILQQARQSTRPFSSCKNAFALGCLVRLSRWASLLKTDGYCCSLPFEMDYFPACAAAA